MQLRFLNLYEVLRLFTVAKKKAERIFVSIYALRFSLM